MVRWPCLLQHDVVLDCVWTAADDSMLPSDTCTPGFASCVGLPAQNVVLLLEWTVADDSVLPYDACIPVLAISFGLPDQDVVLDLVWTVADNSKHYDTCISRCMEHGNVLLGVVVTKVNLLKTGTTCRRLLTYALHTCAGVGSHFCSQFCVKASRQLSKSYLWGMRMRLHIRLRPDMYIYTRLFGDLACRVLPPPTSLTDHWSWTCAQWRS